MGTKIRFFMGTAALAIALAMPALAETTKSVTSKSSVVNPDGSVSYESHTVTTKAGAPAVVGDGEVVPGAATTPVTFYYYDPDLKRIVAASDLTPAIISLWDADHNNVIDNHEFYTNAMIVYEPIEYSKRTYQDINADGIPDLTQEEYTQRLQQVPMYSKLNTDNKPGLTIYEFTGVGFRDADTNKNNQVSFDELRHAFYYQKGLAPKPEHLNH